MHGCCALNSICSELEGFEKVTFLSEPIIVERRSVALEKENAPFRQAHFLPLRQIVIRETSLSASADGTRERPSISVVNFGFAKMYVCGDSGYGNRAKLNQEAGNYRQ